MTVLLDPSCLPRAGTRRRGQALEQAIYDATVEELRTNGLGGFTMEGVAARAQTGKASLYRRWASKDDLIIDAVDHILPPIREPKDTGSLRGDVLDFLGQMRRVMNSDAGCAMQVLMSVPKTDAAFMRLVHERAIRPRKEMMLTILRRGVARGEVRPDAVSLLVAEAAPSLIAHHFMTEGPPVPKRLLESVVDDVLIPLVRP